MAQYSDRGRPPWMASRLSAVYLGRVSNITRRLNGPAKPLVGTWVFGHDTWYCAYQESSVVVDGGAGVLPACTSVSSSSAPTPHSKCSRRPA